MFGKMFAELVILFVTKFVDAKCTTKCGIEWKILFEDDLFGMFDIEDQFWTSNVYYDLLGERENKIKRDQNWVFESRKQL